MNIAITIERCRDAVWATARKSNGKVVGERFGPTQAIAVDRVKADVEDLVSRDHDRTPVLKFEIVK